MTAYFLNNFDFTALYMVLVWLSALLAVAWMAAMRSDPALWNLPPWHLNMRRAGILITEGGLLTSVLFGNELHWTPWPPMVAVVFGLNVYMTSMILTSRERAKTMAFG